MSVRYVFFDLDGTLLPMDLNEFTSCYLSGLGAYLADQFDPQKMVKSIWEGTYAMLKNDGRCSNEQVFWHHMEGVWGESIRNIEPRLDIFYREEFEKIKSSVGFHEGARRAVCAVKQGGMQAVLATNPIFPMVATRSRIRWAGLEESDFVAVTSYENSRYCKPNPAYFEDLLAFLDCRADECVMVGNDTSDDLAAEKLGMRVFLLTNCLINTCQKDISSYPQGDFDELCDWISELNA